MAKKPDTVSGIIVINKHAGVTSFRIISILRRLFDTPRVGHTGTLDPMATGVLPVLLGRAVKASDYIMAQDKRYIAEMRLGIETDTEDTSGKILRECADIPSEDRVREVVSSFIGETSQIPPMYSAIKIDGRKLVDIAREGGEIEREARRVRIDSIGVEKLSDTDYRLDVECSKGTYIRTLCADIGKKLGCGGAMSALERVRTGSFTIEDAYTVEELENMSFEERLSLPRPVEELFSDLPEVRLVPFFANLFLSGAALFQKKIRASVGDGELVRVKCGDLLLGLGKGGADSDGNAVVRPEKLFYLGKV